MALLYFKEQAVNVNGIGEIGIGGLLEYDQCE